MPALGGGRLTRPVPGQIDPGLEPAAPHQARADGGLDPGLGQETEHDPRARARAGPPARRRRRRRRWRRARERRHVGAPHVQDDREHDRQRLVEAVAIVVVGVEHAHAQPLAPARRQHDLGAVTPAVALLDASARDQLRVAAVGERGPTELPAHRGRQRGAVDALGRRRPLQPHRRRVVHRRRRGRRGARERRADQHDQNQAHRRTSHRPPCDVRRARRMLKALR